MSRATVTPGARLPPRCPPRVRTRDEMREALSDAWERAVGVAEELKQHHPVHFAACRLSVRMLTSALLTMDRVLAELG